MPIKTLNLYLRVVIQEPMQSTSHMKRELTVLIERFENGYKFYFSKGSLNSEGRKLCVKIGVLAGPMFPERNYKVKYVLADGSDGGVLDAVKRIKESLAATSEA